MASSPEDILTDVQIAFLAAFNSRAPQFYLTGGAALAAFHLYHRESVDLDLFTPDETAFKGLPAHLEAVSRDHGFGARPLRKEQAVEPIRRYLVDTARGAMLVDFVYDPLPQAVPEKPSWKGIRYDSIEDLASNKIRAFVGREDPYDLIDLYFIEKSGLRLVDAFPAAQRKEPGLTPAHLAHAIHRFPWPAALPRFPRILKPVTMEEMRATMERVAEELAVAAFPKPPDQRPPAGGG